MIGDLCMHLADLLQNSLRAGARHIEVGIERRGDCLVLWVADDGSGFSEDGHHRACDPFYTSKPGRQVGLGLPLLCQTAEQAGGEFSLRSPEEGGTRVEARLPWDHPDRPPLGDPLGTVLPLIATSPGVEFVVRLRHDHAAWELDTREIRAALGDVPLTHGEVFTFLEEEFREGLKLTGFKEDE